MLCFRDEMLRCFEQHGLSSPLRPHRCANRGLVENLTLSRLFFALGHLGLRREAVIRCRVSLRSRVERRTLLGNPPKTQATSGDPGDSWA
jgi:transposase InsO family protein